MKIFNEEIYNKLFQMAVAGAVAVSVSVEVAGCVSILKIMNIKCKLS